MSNLIHKRDPRPEERVKVHMNLNNGMLVISSRTGEDAGRVIKHSADPVGLKNVRFHVSEGGLRRIRARGCREVVAWALGVYVEDFRGALEEEFGAAPAAPCARGGFNPFEADYFTNGEGRGVENASLALFRPEHPQIDYYDPSLIASQGALF